MILVITKIDRVEASRVEEVARTVMALVPERMLKAFPVSNVSGEGVPELQGWLDKRATGFKARRAAGNFRLYTDRVFTLKGVGLVVTGTAVSGQVSLRHLSPAKLYIGTQRLACRIFFIEPADSFNKAGHGNSLAFGAH